jgi:hypothetical protein
VPIIHVFFEEKEGIIDVFIYILFRDRGFFKLFGVEYLDNFDAMLLSGPGIERGVEPYILCFSAPVPVKAIVRARHDEISPHQRTCTP